MSDAEARCDRFCHGTKTMNDERRAASIRSGLRWGLTALFLLRILAQPLANRIPALPPFDTWQGSHLPYPLLLASQFVIFSLMVWGNLRAPELRAQPRLARVLTIIGAAYFVMMFVRLCVGLVWTDAPVWFQRPLPAFFHLVLASWMLLMAREWGRPHV